MLRKMIRAIKPPSDSPLSKLMYGPGLLAQSMLSKLAKADAIMAA